MEDLLLKAARERFGLSYLFPYQRLVITNILAAAEALSSGSGTVPGDDDQWGRQIVILPTGAGKSLCFQLPATLIDGTTLVIYPLLSLMNDQERRIAEAGFSVVQLKGGQSRNEREALEKRVRQGCDFILTNPETLAGPSVRKLLGQVRPVHAVVDEAHCISEWGDTFRESYLTLGESLAAVGIPLVTAFTATASDHVIRRIREVLFPETGAHLIRGNADRENITYSVLPVFSKRRALAAVIEGGPGLGKNNDTNDDDTGYLPVFQRGDTLPRPAIVFCRTRLETQLYARIAARLIGPERCYVYHAGLPRDTKKKVEEAFFADDDGILAATCAYGMGVDKKNIRSVIHTYLPATAEAFLQESGRAGRDGKPSVSVTFIDGTDVALYEERLRSGTAGPVEKTFFSGGCRRTVLLGYLGYNQDTCSGCDRCVFPEKQWVSPALEMAVMSMVVTPHRLTRREWIALWTGRLSFQARLAGHRGLPGYNLFPHWREDELEEALEHLEALGVVHGTSRYLRLSRKAIPQPVQGRRGPLRPFRLCETEGR
jgi:ATP-dependent DNA helicase RecQ